MEALPLATLSQRMTLGPPDLETLIGLIDQSDVIIRFLEIVREFLPENEGEIMRGSVYKRVETFITLFSNQYFPIEECPFDDEAMDWLVSSIPIHLSGLIWEDYHEFQNFRNGHQMLLALVSNPWVEEENMSGMIDDSDRHARVPLLEGVADIVGKGVASRIPKDGWPAKVLHELLDGTRFSGAAIFADWVCQQTDTVMLDCNHEYVGCGMMYEEGLEWDRDNVEALLEQWPRVQEYMNTISSLIDWLEDSPQANFAELLDFIEGKESSRVPKEQMALPGLGSTDQNRPKTLMEIFQEEEREHGEENEDEREF